MWAETVRFGSRNSCALAPFWAKLTYQLSSSNSTGVAVTEEICIPQMYSRLFQMFGNWSIVFTLLYFCVQHTGDKIKQWYGELHSGRFSSIPKWWHHRRCTASCSSPRHQRF
jgi:hypothetical protein